MGFGALAGLLPGVLGLSTVSVGLGVIQPEV